MSIQLISHLLTAHAYWSYVGHYDEGCRSSISAELPAGCPHIPDIDWTNLARPHGLNVNYQAGSLWAVWVNPCAIVIAKVENISQEQADRIASAWKPDHDDPAQSLFVTASGVLDKKNPQPALRLVT